MKRGTKSILFGAHQFILHPLFVAAAWTRLYGFPFDPRLWVAFLVHDWGYWNAKNMDDAEGQRHPELGGRIMARLFGEYWGDFTRLHSRYYARLEGKPVSDLMAADKLATTYVPAWLYVPLATWSGEIYEYMALPGSWQAWVDGEHDGTRYGWYAWLRGNFRKAAQGTAAMDAPLKRTLQ